ncbi:hypothetical protein RJ639_007134 [Escallonia herrerae]|uniref:Uncharacterized protein n=1 Tax=Escallonia herrerae TaxID=1293975 RepID=A0AA88VXF8_9ASTE|nr:hypothetical protein RJ639_007134 [Escallonia herrerae]
MPDINDAKLNLEVYELTHKLKHDSNGQPLEEQDRPYVSKKAKAIRNCGDKRLKGCIRGTRETARDARASMHISLDQPPSSKNWKDEIAKIVQLEVQKMKEIEIAKLVEIEAEISATDAAEDGNDETFDELGG